ncbi:phosphatidylinositol-specific phospholipase C domain-containing protein [Pedobacter frigidisoli]|uniref:1-phosphatidylinositol phosphodiesterase n=1 Tax=Pedobacter frigidisoli TaxID=2530455 RepID=A0A4R0NI50_9SPHI|nr:phosphatidylinositol-specific phospholipase C [Pedobacter frigidisoli]TCD00291.1 phosphatidylinositol-specific phospholipase C domain-containing protein [Pedobacter frigidisoli]
MKRLSLLLAVIACSFTACKKEQESPLSDFSGNENNLQQLDALQLQVPTTLNNWMLGLPNTTAIGRLSIPGTHDSGALFEPISSTAKCQNISIAEQLKIGVRYLDIRCRHIDNAFAIHHGAIYQNLNFQDVINACISFLNVNPSETILMCVKEEHTPSNNTRSFEQTFDSYTQQNPGKWSLSNDLPNLGSLRGRIKLIRRFSAAATKGINATAWADNTAFDISNSYGGIKIQDFYKVNDLPSKWTAVEQLLNAAMADGSNKLYINYSSGYQPGIFSIPNINAVANYINPKLSQYFSSNSSGRYGVIPMDFVDQAKAQLILNKNF